MNINKLMEMSANAMQALDLGKAAEHLVCADLLLNGYRAYLSDQGLPYDVVVDVDGKLIRVQVKATCFAKDRNTEGKRPRQAYHWSIRKRGKNRKGTRLGTEHCDIVALVALDIAAVAYLPIELCGQGIALFAPGYEIKTKFRHGSQWVRPVTDLPFAEAISGDHSQYKAGFRKLTHCIHGHEYTPENTYHTTRGKKACRQCVRTWSRETARRNREATKTALLTIVGRRHLLEEGQPNG